MQALRAHPFFASIDWKTLWTDPAPTLQPGLVKKDPVVRQGQARHADIGALWDSLVEGEHDKDDDGLSWAPDAEAPLYLFGRRGGYKARPESGIEEGPMGESPQYTCSLSTRPEEEDTATMMVHSCREDTIGGLPQSCSSNGTSTSSSSDNSLNGLTSGLGKLVIDRGRDRTPTPVQGNFQFGDVDL
jgi:3-phosphoinositide dependent protein kinase-1